MPVWHELSIMCDASLRVCAIQLLDCTSTALSCEKSSAVIPQDDGLQQSNFTYGQCEFIEGFCIELSPLPVRWDYDVSQGNAFHIAPMH